MTEHTPLDTEVRVIDYYSYWEGSPHLFQNYRQESCFFLCEVTHPIISSVFILKLLTEDKILTFSTRLLGQLSKFILTC